MELVEAYLKKHGRNIKELKEKYMELPEAAWSLFHEQSHRTMAVVAGRGTGKSYNVAKRACKTRNNVIIMCASSTGVGYIRTMIEEYIQEHRDAAGYGRIVGFNLNSIGTTITMDTGRKIEIISSNMHSFFRGRDLNNVTLIIDEAEHCETSLRIMMASDHPLMNVEQIIMVGSIRRRLDTAFKQFYRDAEYQQIIDNTEMDSVSSFSIEYSPGRFRFMFEEEPEERESRERPEMYVSWSGI